MNEQVTVWRVEIDELDEHVAGVRWYASEDEARREEAAIEEQYGRPQDWTARRSPLAGRPVMATVSAVTFPLTRDGVLEMLRRQCATTEPE